MHRHPLLLWPALKARSRAAAAGLAGGIAATGLHPNALTLIGLALTGAAGALVANGWYVVGAVLFLAASALDGLDGAVARAAGKVSAFGAFLDSIADRYGEAALFLGLLIQLHLRGETGPLVACALALVGSVMVSYARARAEGLGIACEVGFLQRPERVLLLAAGLLVAESLLVPILWLLAFATNFTVLQRVVHVRRLLGSGTAPQAGPGAGGEAQPPGPLSAVGPADPPV